MTSRAVQFCLAGRMPPVGRRLESPELNNIQTQMHYGIYPNHLLVGVEHIAYRVGKSKILFFLYPYLLVSSATVLVDLGHPEKPLFPTLVLCTLDSLQFWMWQNCFKEFITRIFWLVLSTTKICTFPSCLIPVIKSQHNTCFLLNITTRFSCQCFKIMDVTIINNDYLFTCLAGTDQPLMTSVLGKHWAFSEETYQMYTLYWKEQYATKHAKNVPTFMLLHGEKPLTRSCTKVWQDSVCPKAPLCVAKHHGKV